MRKVFGFTLKGDRKEVELYERIHTGYGDGVMLRAAIIANMKRYPERRHILHIYAGVAPIFCDIKGLEIVSVIEPYRINDAELAATVRYDISTKKMVGHNITNLYKLSSPCADYESFNSPYSASEETRIRVSFSRQDDYWPSLYPKLRFNKDRVFYAMPTGKRITKSRQEIFCETIGVPFSLDNYNVIFSEEEKQVADNIISQTGDTVGLQMRTSTHQRDYDYMIELVEYIASKVNSVVTFDRTWSYKGGKSNVLSYLDSNIRNVWSVISRMKMFISPDSFGVHAAGSTGVPTYGIFGPTDPKCRLSDYQNTAWSPKWKLPIARRGFKLGCGRQYCWYKTCKTKMCLNARSPKFYWDHAISHLEGI